MKLSTLAGVLYQSVILRMLKRFSSSSLLRGGFPVLEDLVECKSDDSYLTFWIKWVTRTFLIDFKDNNIAISLTTTIQIQNLQVTTVEFH